MFIKTEVKYKKGENNDHSGNRFSLFMNSLTIKRYFIQFMRITALLANYQCVELCLKRNEDKSVISIRGM